MHQNTRKFLRGIGSVLNLWPRPATTVIRVRQPEELVRESWERVGRHLGQAMSGAQTDERRQYQLYFPYALTAAYRHTASR